MFAVSATLGRRGPPETWDVDEGYAKMMIAEALGGAEQFELTLREEIKRDACPAKP